MTKELDELIAKAKAIVDAMTPEQKAEMLRKQGEGWASATLCARCRRGVRSRRRRWTRCPSQRA